MKRALLAGFAAIAVMAQTAPPSTPAAPALNCGGSTAARSSSTISTRSSDTLAYTGQQKRLASSCYLIKHGDRLHASGTAGCRRAEGGGDRPQAADVADAVGDGQGAACDAWA